MQSFIKAFMYIAITFPLLSYIKKASGKDKKSKSKKKFRVHIPRIYPQVLRQGAFVFILLFLCIYLYNGIFFEDFDATFLYLGTGIALFIGLLCLVLTRWHLEVMNENLIYYTPYGRKKTTTFVQLDSIQRTPQHSLILKVNKKRFGTLHPDFIGYSNFVERCEVENINIVPKSIRPLTKFRLYYYAMQQMLWIGMIVSGVLLIITLFSENYSLVDRLFILLFAFLVIIIPTSFNPLADIRRISKQEKVLNFSFHKEMETYTIKEPTFINDTWFIYTKSTRIIVIHRNYVQSMGTIQATFQDKSLQHEAKLVTMSGDQVKVKAPKFVLDDLAKWIDDTSNI